jgi:hypothetical protein
MLRQIVGALTVFDWITPLWGFAQDITHDPTLTQEYSRTFFINYNDLLRSGWNATDVANLLRNNGINSWGSQITKGELFFSVDKGSASIARYHLDRNGIQYYGG